MTISTLLRGALVNNGGVSALVSTRVYPFFLPQTPTYPAMSFQRISNTGQKGTSDLKESRWQLDCWGSTYTGVQALAAAAKAAIEEFHDIDQVPGINMARVVNELDDYDDVVKVYRVIVDVMLHTTGD